MDEARAYLPLYLSAPLQSWGYQSRFDRRTSLPYPTKSGVVGMICAAIGIDWADSSAIREIEQVQMTVLALGGGGSLVDFHTVGAGYDRVREKLRIPHTAGGTLRAAGKETVVTRREYLDDCAFGVLLAGPPLVLERIARALRDPRWGIWLGRKSCIPAMPICTGGPFSTEVGAREHLASVASPRRAWRIVSEAPDFTQGTDTLHDRPLDFRTRDFAPRRVAVVELGHADLREASP